MKIQNVWVVTEELEVVPGSHQEFADGIPSSATIFLTQEDAERAADYWREMGF